jgi:hypothetical protein
MIKTRIQLLAKDLSDKLNDKKNFGWYLKIAKKYPEEFLRLLLSEVLELSRRKQIRNKAAYFIIKLQSRKKDVI